MKTKLPPYTEAFQEVYDDGYKQMYIRNFGSVFLDDDKEVKLLCIAEIYDLDRSGAVREDELPENGPVMLTFTLLPEYKFISKKHKAAAVESGCGGNSDPIIDVVEYMGGLRYEPSSIVWFKTNELALEHLMTKELNDQIYVQGRMSGFVMDQYYNRAGETNWSRLDKIMTGK